MIKRIFSSALALVFGLVGALPAFAATASLYGNTTTSTAVTTPLPVTLNAGNQTTVSAGVSAAGGTSTGGVTSGTALDATEQTNTNTPVDTSAVMLDQSSLGVQGSNASQVSSADQVNTRDDLNSYALNAMRADTNIQSLSMAQDAVTVDYKQPGKLLGLIKVEEATHIQVGSDGTVKMTYPWYHFLVSSNMPNLQSDLQARAETILSAKAAANSNAATGVTLSDKDRAQILSSVLASVSSNISANANLGAINTSGSAAGNAQGNTDTSY